MFCKQIELSTKMKSLVKTIILLTSIAAFNSISYSQCKVLKESISEEYDGDCKKGLAHGKGKAIGLDTYEGEFKKGQPHGDGIYTYSYGSVYEGQWRFGVKEGAGKMTIPTFKGDSVIAGYWRDDRYIGETNVPAYSVVQKNNIERYTIKKIAGDNQSKIVIKTQSQNGLNSRVTDLQIVQSSGINQPNNSYSTLSSVEFPFEGSVTYTTPNKTNTIDLNVTFRFKINDPGSWEVILYN